MTMKTLMTVVALGVVATAPALAQQQYVSASAGFNFQSDSDNSGAFTSDFVTGDGVAVPAGTTLPAGTSLAWTTEFDEGLFLSAAYGRYLTDAVRVEAELSYTTADVDTHTGVTAGGGALGAADAAVLITGSAPLGVTVADLVADGQGDITSLGLAANVYYDIALGEGPVSAYIGGGVGIADVDVEFTPSAVEVLSDSATVGFYQIMFGGAYELSETTSLFAGYRWRQSGDAELDTALVPAELDIENASQILEFGVRFGF